MRASRTKGQKSEVRSQMSERLFLTSDFCLLTSVLCPLFRRRLLAAACATALAGGCQSVDNFLRPVLPESVGNMVLKDGKFQADATAARGAEQLNAAQEV